MVQTQQPVVAVWHMLEARLVVPRMRQAPGVEALLAVQLGLALAVVGRLGLALAERQLEARELVRVLQSVLVLVVACPQT